MEDKKRKEKKGDGKDLRIRNDKEKETRRMVVFPREREENLDKIKHERAKGKNKCWKSWKRDKEQENEGQRIRHAGNNGITGEAR